MLPLSSHKQFILFRGGSRSAFHFLFEQHHSLLHQYIFIRCGDAALTRQYLLQIFGQVWDNRAAFESERELVVYLYFVAKYKLAGIQQDSEQRKTAEEEWLRWTENTSGGEKEKEISKVDVNYILKIAVEHLPPQRRRVIKKIFCEGKSTNQVAAEMKLANQTVLNQKSRAISFLKKEVATLLHYYHLTGRLPH